MSRPSLQPLASTPSPPFSSLSFLPSVSRTYQPLSKKRKSAHATQLANVTVLLEAPARGSAIFRHIEIEKCRLDARRRQGNGKHGRPCCSCLSMLPYGIANKQVPVLWIHLSPLHTIDRASVFRHTVDVKKKKGNFWGEKERETRWKREIGCVSSKV